MEPIVRHGLSKRLVKGEDSHVSEAEGRLEWEGWMGIGSMGWISYSCYGVFDGHGGRMASRYCSKHALEFLRSEWKREMEGNDARKVRDLLEGEGWSSEESILEVAGRFAPEALKRCFLRLNQSFNEKEQLSGCTGTMALQVGWSLTVASVGDSLALVDVAHEVIQISGDHRLDRSVSEQERVVAEGDVLARSASPMDEEDGSCDPPRARGNGNGVGPLRVWPGGLAMSRTIGDARAGKSVVAIPEVRQITIPKTGCRLIVASDGLWDAMSLKATAHAARGSVPTAAAGLLVKAACKARGQRDDVTVIVVDFIPPGEKKLAIVTSYSKELQRSIHSGESNVRVRRPLEEDLPLSVPLTLHGVPSAHKAASGPESDGHCEYPQHVEEGSVSELHRPAIESDALLQEEVASGEEWIPESQKQDSRGPAYPFPIRTVQEIESEMIQVLSANEQIERVPAVADSIQKQNGRRRWRHPRKNPSQKPAVQAGDDKKGQDKPSHQKGDGSSKHEERKGRGRRKEQSNTKARPHAGSPPKSPAQKPPVSSPTIHSGSRTSASSAATDQPSRSTLEGRGDGDGTNSKGTQQGGARRRRTWYPPRKGKVQPAEKPNRGTET